MKKVLVFVCGLSIIAAIILFIKKSRSNYDDFDKFNDDFMDGFDSDAC